MTTYEKERAAAVAALDAAVTDNALALYDNSSDAAHGLASIALRVRDLFMPRDRDWRIVAFEEWESLQDTRAMTLTSITTFVAEHMRDRLRLDLTARVVARWHEIGTE